MSFLRDREAIATALKNTGVAPRQVAAIINETEKTEADSIVEKLVQRVVLQPEGIALTLSLSPLLPSHEGPLPITRDIPMQMKRRGVETRMVIGEQRPARVDPNLIKILARAHAWYEEFISGRITSFSQITDRHHLDKGDVSRIITLAFLAPDIVEDIVSGHQPADLTVQKLLRQIQLPLNWDEQRRILGYR